MALLNTSQQVSKSVINVDTDTSLFDLINLDEKETESLQIDRKHVLSLLQPGNKNPDLDDKNRDLIIMGYGNLYECSKSSLRCIVSKEALLLKSSDFTEFEEINVKTYAVYCHVIPFLAQCVVDRVGCYISREILSEESDDNRILCYLMSADNSAKLHFFTKNRFITHPFSLSAALNKYFLKRDKQTYREWIYCSPEALQLLISGYSQNKAA
ncbi:hypothetical protein [Rheinheimera soli]|uniref:hypothetical protein n=1 Tax=Rheinheimera soli TaxID=443616 RepID=UPI001E3C338F|nr:hypothetical protein [Rheinheimera soli]